MKAELVGIAGQQPSSSGYRRMILFKTRWAVAAALLAILTTACGDTAPAVSTTTLDTNTAEATTQPPPSTTAVDDAFPVTISTDLGNVEIAATPSRIVSMSATHTEMLYAIGAGEQVVAVDAFSDYPPEAPVTDLTGFAPNVEAIIGYDADLVVTDGDWDGTSMGALTDLGVPVLILPAAVTLDDVYNEIEQLGAATGHIAEAAALVSQMQIDIESILDSVPPTAVPLTFYHELDDTYYSVTSATFIGHIYDLMGLDNIADAVGDDTFGYPQLSEEYILQQDPDLIFLADTICCGITGESIQDRPGWNNLTAVQTGSVVELNDDVASRWGPRIVDHIRIVATATAALSVGS